MAPSIKKRPFPSSSHSLRFNDSRKKHQTSGLESSHHPPSGSQRFRSSTASVAGVDNEGPSQFLEDELDQVIVAIDKKDAGTIGCSYYSAQEEKLYLLGDIRYAGNETIDSCQSRTCAFDATRMH